MLSFAFRADYSESLAAVFAIISKESWFSTMRAVYFERYAAVAAVDLTNLNWISTFWTPYGSYGVSFSAERADVIVRVDELAAVFARVFITWHFNSSF